MSIFLQARDAHERALVESVTRAREEAAKAEAAKAKAARIKAEEVDGGCKPHVL